MKKSTLILVFAFSFLATVSFGQVEPHAIGFRAGSGTFGSGAEISYQHGFGSSNRLELDLGWRNGYHKHKHNYYAWGLTGIYHWVWNLDGGLNWFAGPGAQIGAYNNRDHDYDDGLTLNVGGQIGIEYNFNELGAPLQLGLDVRPMWGFVGYYHRLGMGGALSFRYTF